jgi:N-methylhydantoinase A
VFEATRAAWRNTPVYERQALAAGARIKGPALIAEDQTTTVVTADFDASVNGLGCLVLDQRKKGSQ